ncbi:hypothetical protein M408DRAFT_27936 [Serendipita vermifera MAFF 305830]|uniref:F-box domain-containing protein n=1 Tax=Serendipita vermifera MAFF 305830 TaxID=933852 RepID=A0A0C2WAA4_SERVB|nr:hypothetical protein M408DRAFT_27936 [Serendipita vermifera MAFF 305830]
MSILASSSLSVEVWQLILRHAISVADFLDPDSFEGDLKRHGFGAECRHKEDEEVYWEAERARKRLVRVCKSWRGYLSLFEHRFVRMSDIWHRRIDKTAILKATRIDVATFTCSCAEICDEVADLSSRFSTFCVEIVRESRNLPVEILQGFDKFAEEVWDAQVFTLLDRLQVVLSPLSNRGVRIPSLSQIPTLRNFWPGVYSEFPKKYLVFKSPVTLFYVTNSTPSATSFDWDLPSLRHLYIGRGHTVEPMTFTVSILLPMLRLVGRRLRSLYIVNRGGIHASVADIWNLCPVVERIRPGMEVRKPPPLNHPVHTLSTPLQYFSVTLEWPNLRRVILENASPYVPDDTKAMLVRWSESKKMCSWSLEDDKGEYWDPSKWKASQ